LEIIYLSDVPTKLGLATSTSMTVCLLKGLYYYNNVAVAPELLFDKAYKLEREIINHSGGFQDGSVIWGGFNYLTGSPYRVKRTPITLSIEKTKLLKNHILLLYTGNRAESTGVLEEQLTQLKKGKTLEESLKIKSLVEEMHVLLTQPDFHPMHLTHAMKDAWELKKKLSSSMSSPLIDKVEECVLNIEPQAGIRLVGSGGGRGLIMVLAPPEKHPQIEEACGLKKLDFEFDWDGAKVRRMYE
jgi:D-glycero-alpha-D-manno-heptose-7-phosphate kinase